ncbi:hypothetical protein J3L16_08995 [Alteromonas sp. 5E99-2]|uniref:hypothetical protein n=1 Tax=Alteromonas sp. 5E99-2 TaxID=2817683 RepID=UPI001A985E49|nr:hypothetical protein [Alteromonas sp. 5E99-2]MBO1255818.1 hypothetical protein [Alteromonas sp. 5E99-2]
MTFNSTKVLSFTILLLCFISVFSIQLQANEKKDETAINNIIQNFKDSIENKDDSLFLSLFHSSNVSWVGVISDETLETLISLDPKFKQQPKIMNSTPNEFIQNIVSSKQQSKEVFKDIQIFQDGEVASVSFNYDFYKDEKLTNYGQEHWQLINTSEGWKINAVNFSFSRVF